MKAAVLNRLGDVPAFAGFTPPEIRPDEALVRVSAAAIKQLERAIVAGTHYGPKELPVIRAWTASAR